MEAEARAEIERESRRKAAGAQADDDSPPADSPSTSRFSDEGIRARLMLYKRAANLSQRGDTAANKPGAAVEPTATA